MRPLLPLVGLSAVLVLTGCSSSGGFSQPKVSAFSSGSCRDIAPGVLDLGKDLHTLGSKTPDTSASTKFKNAQAAVRTFQPAVSASLATPLQDFMTSIGILRLRTDTNSYDASLQKNAMATYANLVSICTGKGPLSTPTPTATP